LGVSHVLDLTPLDHLGLPVFLSVRPGGTTEQVHLGKGITADHALAGALMEAAEYAATESESRAGVDGRLSISKLVSTWPAGLVLSDFAPRLGAVVGARAQLAVVSCEVLGTRRRLLLPADLVLLPAPMRSGPQMFGTSSNGLASGNTLEEATLHALFEVLERDTVALHIARDESRPLVATTLPAAFAIPARRWQRQGVSLHVRWLPNALGLPCFEAGLHDGRTPLAASVLCRGWGLHFDRQVALSRAICEAAQARLAVILAQRPDLPGGAAMARRLSTPSSPERTARLLARLTNARHRVRLEDVPHEELASVRQALRTLLSRMAGAGLGPVFRRRLALDGDPAGLRGLQVVKVVVARSETPIGAHPRLGPRLLARLQGA